jgi:transcriptional regulator with XRE-family HTH domain
MFSLVQVGKDIKRARHAADLTLDELAADTATDVLLLARLERGELLIVEDLIVLRDVLARLDLPYVDDTGLPLPPIGRAEDDTRPKVPLYDTAGNLQVSVPIDEGEDPPNDYPMTYFYDDETVWEVLYQLQPRPENDPPWAYVEAGRRQLDGPQ